MIFNFILIMIILVLIYVIINLYNKLRKCEKLITDTEISNELNYINFYKSFKEMANRLIAIDKKGSFKSEDEVGYSWNIFMKLIEDMDELFKTILEK